MDINLRLQVSVDKILIDQQKIALLNFIAEATWENWFRVAIHLKNLQNWKKDFIRLICSTYITL